MFVSVVIPTFNRAEMLQCTLSSLERLIVSRDHQWEVLVVDNNSKDNTKTSVEQFLRTKTLPLQYLFEKKQGSSYARNKGAQEANGEIVAFVDDDVQVHPDWLIQTVQFFKTHQCIAMGGRVLATGVERLPRWAIIDGPFKIAGITVRHDNGDKFMDYDLKMIMPISANLAVRKHAIDQYGGFRTDLGRGGTDSSIVAGEDTEFCRRILDAGERIGYCPDSIVYHPVAEERISKRYCRNFYFWLGRGMAQTSNIPDKARCIMNIPFFVFRELTEHVVGFLRSFITLNFNKTFYYQLHIVMSFGKLFQFSKMRAMRSVSG